MKGKGSYIPSVGETVLVSPPNCDNEDGYVYDKTTVLWMDSLFILFGRYGFWPALYRIEHCHIKLYEPEGGIKVDNQETILCSAIHIEDCIKHPEQPSGIKTGYVVTGRRHGDCHRLINMLQGKPYLDALGYTENNWRDFQGFLTSGDRYVSRREAWVLAEAAGQIKHGYGASKNGADSELISENLY